MIYLCFPNNPTGTTITKDQLQVWVDYANKVGAVIIYDAAYEAYISEKRRTSLRLYECEGPEPVLSSFAAFPKTRALPGRVWVFTVVPKD